MARLRTKLARYNPDHVKTLRDQMLECPDPIYRLMFAKSKMSDGDTMDFALSLAIAYFSGTLKQK